MSRADLNSAAYAARAALAVGFDNCGGDMDSIFAAPLAAINRALRGDDKPESIRGAASVLCMLAPGYGSPSYRGAPLDAVALQQEAERVASDANHETAKWLVASHVFSCVSSLIGSLLKTAGNPESLLNDDDVAALSGKLASADEFAEAERFADDDQKVTVESDTDDVGEFWRWRVVDVAGDDIGTGTEDSEPEAWQAAWREAERDDPEGSEAFEHWTVSGYLAEKMRAYGESIADDVCGLTVWARCTTGQSIYMDWLFQRIAADINRSEEREPSRDELERASAAICRVAVVDADEAPGAISREFATLSNEPESHYRNGATCFAVACRARFGFDPRDILS